MYRSQSMFERPSTRETLLPATCAFGRNKPRFYHCYICGNEFGTASIPIHVKTCYKRRRACFERTSARDQERNPLPQDPALISKDAIYDLCIEYGDNLVAGSTPLARDDSVSCVRCWKES